MGRFEILKSKKIITADKNVVEELDKNIMTSVSRINKSIEQYKSIVVCEDEDGYLVVDGNKYFKSLKKNGLKKILCYNLGNLKDGEYELYRVLLNVHQARLDYLEIAELITALANKEIKLTTIANKTGLDLQSVERYSTLLNFDWDEFNRKQINEQINPFENER